MRRKIYESLLSWKNEENGAVAPLIEGARRVGKSYIVEEFGRREYNILAGMLRPTKSKSTDPDQKYIATAGNGKINDNDDSR